MSVITIKGGWAILKLNPNKISSIRLYSCNEMDNYHR